MCVCLCVCVCVCTCVHVSHVQGKTVLELAAGIGRFTGDIADQAKFVTVVEFMEKFIKANIKANDKVFHECLHFYPYQHWFYSCS